MRALANRRARVLALAILLAAVLVGVYALGLLIPEEAIAGSYLQAGQAPSLSHPFGTDALGRDLLLRTLTGLSTSMTVGIAASARASRCWWASPRRSAPGAWTRGSTGGSTL